MGLTILILLLLVIMIGLLIYRTYQFKRPRTIRWQIGHQVFTFQFPFNWMHLNSRRYFKDIMALIGIIVVGFIIFVALMFFLFLFLGILLPIILIISLIALILFLIFVI